MTSTSASTSGPAFASQRQTLVSAEYCEGIESNVPFDTQGESSEGVVLAASDTRHGATLGKLHCPEEGALLVQEVTCRSHRTFRGFCGGLLQVTGGLEGHSLGSKDTFTKN